MEEDVLDDANERRGGLAKASNLVCLMVLLIEARGAISLKGKLINSELSLDEQWGVSSLLVWLRFPLFNFLIRKV